MSEPVTQNANTRPPIGRGTKGGATAAVIVLAAVFIQHWEGTDLVAKHNSFDPAGVITVCNGMTNYDKPTLKVGDTYTKEECAGELRQDIPKYDAMLRSCVHVEMPLHRYVAFLSFIYNLGKRTVCNSTAVRELNMGRIPQACQAMTLYDKANGVVMRGLKNRREDKFWGERAWCLRED